MPHTFYPLIDVSTMINEVLGHFPVALADCDMKRANVVTPHMTKTVDTLRVFLRQPHHTSYVSHKDSHMNGTCHLMTAMG